MSGLEEFQHLKIQLQDIISATNNFADGNCIGCGGFGKVYKGEIVVHSKGQSMVALKRLDRVYGQGDPEFWKEIMMLSLYKHENIVSLLGFCDESDERILVYKYASKKSLDLYLNSDDLTWVRRLKICIGAARGLAYLHNADGTQQRLLHRDVKSSNILLDENWDAQISDLGLSRFGPANQQYTFLVSRPVGTFGYCDPLYVETGLLTKESDVYSFGVVLFEVLCGRLCIGNNNNNDKRSSLIELVRQSYKQNKINEIIFGNIKDEIDPNSLTAFSAIAYRCLKRDRKQRPLMTEIVGELETAIEYQTISSKPEKGRMSPEKAISRSQETDEELVFLEGCSHAFDFKDLLEATTEVLGKGAFWTSYVATLEDRTCVVVKRLKGLSVGKHEFEQHMGIVGSIKHENVMELMAYHCWKDEKLIVCEYYSQGSVAKMLHGEKAKYLNPVYWEARLRIAVGAARGIARIHAENGGKLVHGNIKSSNIFLNPQGYGCVSDIGLSTIMSHIAIHAACYMAPEIFDTQEATQASDVYSFGVLLLELVTGKSPVHATSNDESIDFVQSIQNAFRPKSIYDVVDKNVLRYAVSIEETLPLMMQIAMPCVASVPEQRPKMTEVVKMMEDVLTRNTELENLQLLLESLMPPQPVVFETNSSSL